MPIDPATGVWVYSDSDQAHPVRDLLNLQANALKSLLGGVLSRLTGLESQVGSAYGMLGLSADATVGPSEAAVPFNTLRLGAGVTRSGTKLVAQSPGVYLIIARQGSVSTSPNVFRWIRLHRNGVLMPGSLARAATGPSGDGQYATSITVAALVENDQIEARTAGSSGATSTTIAADETMLAMVKVSG